MNYRLPLAVAAVVVCAGSALLWTSHHRPAAKPTSAQAKQLLSQIPLWFESLPDGRFASQSLGRTVLFDNQSATWKLKGGGQVKMAFRNSNTAAAKHGV